MRRAELSNIMRPSPGHRVHEQEVIVGRSRVLAVVPVFLLGCVLDVLGDKFHLFAQVGFRLKNVNKKNIIKNGLLRGQSNEQKKQHWH